MVGDLRNFLRNFFLKTFSQIPIHPRYTVITGGNTHMAESRMKLKKQAGSFELWTRGKGQAIVLVASGQDSTTRVTVPLVSFSGLAAAKSAEQYFNTLIEAVETAQRNYLHYE